MEKLNRKALISPDGLTAEAFYKGEWLTVNLGFPFWQWCECELAELQRSRTVLGAMPEGEGLRVNLDLADLPTCDRCNRPMEDGVYCMGDKEFICHECYLGGPASLWEAWKKKIMDDMEAKLEKLVTAEVEAFEAAKGRQPMRERVGAISERVL